MQNQIFFSSILKWQAILAHQITMNGIDAWSWFSLQTGAPFSHWPTPLIDLIEIQPLINQATATI